MSVEIAPTTSDDISEFLPNGLAWRARALTAKKDGKVIGIGGITYMPNGKAAAFVEATEDDCKAHPITLHRMALKVINEARERGVNEIMAVTDKSREAAARWLERLGFELVGVIDGEAVYRWHRSD